MSVVRGFGLNGKSFYANVSKPQSVFLTFTVNAADTGGLGVTSVKSNGYVNYLFMHTSQTPGVVAGVTNPNPANGYALLSLTNNFNAFLGLRGTVSAPATSTSTTSTTQHSVYTITALGTATLAQWQAAGLPQGLTPTVGQTFVATATGTIGGSAHVGVPGLSAITGITVVGDPNQTISNANVSTNGGAQIVMQFTDLSASGTISAPVLTMNSYTPAGTNDSATPPIFTGTPAVLTGTNSAPTFTNTSSSVAAAPTDGSIVRLQLWYDGSSVTIDGL